MSGMYKWTEITIDPTAAVYDLTTGCMVVAAVAAARASAAAAEAADRLEAEESALRAMLSEAREQGRGAVAQVRSRIVELSDKIADFDRERLLRKIDDAAKSVESARTRTQLRDALLDAERAEGELAHAVRRRRIDDLRRGRTDKVEALREQFESLRGQIAQLESAVSDADPSALAMLTRLKTMAAGCGGALQTANEAMIEARVGELDSGVQELAAYVTDARERSARNAALGQQTVDEAVALVRGLRVDPVVMRWHARAVDALEVDLADLATVDAREAARRVQAARDRAAAIVTEANGAQIKADQRDYIASSIAHTLEEMGFVVGPAQAEHPEHPATASILHAATASGRNISVSVPVDGQVWYNVQGYPKSSEHAVGGGDAAVCDEAETVIEEMHSALAEQFHVQMGELMWDGKDPQRNLRAVESLPKSRSADRSSAGSSKR